MLSFRSGVKRQFWHLWLVILVTSVTQMQAADINQPVIPKMQGNETPIVEQATGINQSTISSDVQTPVIEQAIELTEPMASEMPNNQIPAKPQVPVVDPQLVLKDIGVFAQYGDKAPPSVPARKDSLTFYPCSQCHAHWQTISQPRKLYPVHDVGLNHGQQRFWCLTCHNPNDRDQLTTVQGINVDFNDAWKVCGQCHSARQKDWYYGAHGKRVENWQGDPERYNCTHCHNPHQPPFIKRKPQPKPPIRVGLTPMKYHDREFLPIWERQIPKEKQEH